ncbi:MAG: radical SAM protein [Candidatus Sumerlaeia bacterium]|nr:radical SAM protein [Candidatus Sumerlaeia bacterium]
METPIRSEARFFDRTSWDNVTCRLCPHMCSIAPSRSGQCGVRSNKGGTLHVDSWGKTTSIDHLYAENLPLFHYKPDINWVRLAGRGCTMRCPFCDTWKYSQVGGVRQSRMTPDEAISIARESGAGGIAFGVNEPAPMHEFIEETFNAALRAGMETHLATSAMWSQEPLREIAAVTSAFTIGLKSMDHDFCQTQLGCDLDIVLSNIDMLLTIGAHVELTWLPIPGHSDTPEETERLLTFLGRLRPHPPVILLPYRPDYTWGTTSRASTLKELRGISEQLSNHPGMVYILDPDSPEINTRCRGCGKTLVRRGMARMVITSERNGEPLTACPKCGTPVPFVP